MKKIYSILCLSIIIVGITSCSKDEETALSSLSSIESFKINFEGVEEEDVTYNFGNSIAISVPFDTNLTDLVATISIAENATIMPASGTAVNYVDGEATLFTVTAEDGETTKMYGVTITIRGEVGSGSRIETYKIADLYGENSVTTYKYAESNFVSELKKVVNDFGDIRTIVYQLVYDDKNQIIEKKSTEAKLSTVYQYNEKGQIVTGIYKIKDVLTYTYTYEYDATTDNIISEKRVDHTDNDLGSKITFTLENGNVTKENRYGENYIAVYDDKNNPFIGIYPVAYATINVGIQHVNVNNPVSGTLADNNITYEYNTDNYPISASYTYFGGFATVAKTYTYYAK